jgi:Questin oxidase-like
LIHLSYAYELNSREVAMEALGLVAACYDPHLASLLDANMKTNANSTANPLTYSTSSPFEVLARVSADTRLKDAFTGLDISNVSKLLNTPNLLAILLEHFNAWKITNPKEQFEQSQQLATALLISTAPSVGGHGYDFFFIHLLTSSHAVRVIIPFLDARHHLPLVREWWLITVAIYIAQLRPVVKLDYIREVNLDGRHWAWAEKQAIEGKHSLNTHFVKAVRAMKEAGKVWGDEEDFYLKAAVKFVSEFESWGGFEPEDEEEMVDIQRKQ